MTLPGEILLPLLPKIRARDVVELGKQSEELGYSGVWAPETTGPDGISILVALAAHLYAHTCGHDPDHGLAR